MKPDRLNCRCGAAALADWIRQVATRPLKSRVPWLWTLLVTFTGIALHAQSEPNLENGFKPYGTYSGSSIDSINVENGNLIVHIPMPFGLPQRGRIHPSYFLGVSSKQWSRTCAGATCWWYPAFVFSQSSLLPVARGTGVGFDSSVDLSVTRAKHTVVDTVDSGMNQAVEQVTSVNTPDGSSHPVVGVAGDPTGTYFAKNITKDVTGYLVLESGPDSLGIPEGVAVLDRAGNLYTMSGWRTISVKETIQNVPDPNHPGQNGTITTTDSTQMAVVTSVTDTNGNQVTLGGQDTMGRSVTLQGFSGTQATSDYSGCVSPASQPIGSASISDYTGFNGVTNQVKVCYAPINLATNFGLSGTIECCNASGSTQVQPVSMVVSVVFLVDGSTWSFQYDSYGNVTYIGLPLGGNIQYQWQSFAIPGPGALVSRVVTQRTVNDNNGNSYIWSYKYGGGTYPNPFTNTMTDPLQNDTVTTFSLLPGQINASNDLQYFATTTKHYQGPQSSGKLLKQEDMQYYNNGQTGDNNIVNGFVTQVTTTVNGKVSQVTRTPDAGGYGPNAPNFGVVTVEKKYDFGSGQPGSLLQETDTSYQWQSDGNYLTANMVGLPASVQVKNANGNICAQTDSSYDDPNRLTAYPATVPGHGAPPNSVRGNLTSVGRRLASTACSITSSTPSVTNYTNWYDIGVVYQAIDPLGNRTTHTYDPAYDGAYSTMTCNALNQCVSGTYDFNAGVLTSFTNANATQQASGTTPGDPQHTSTYAYDSLSRLTTATSPPDPSNNNAQAIRQFHFPAPLSLPYTVTHTKSVTNTQTDSLTTTYDGLGRIVKTVHNTAGNATVVTQYDGLDRVISVTNPYFSTSDPTYGIIQTQYDALGRATQVTAQDNGVSTTDYSGFPTVAVTDPAGKQRHTRSDALGRLVEVVEPGSGTNGPGAPATGAITVSGSLAAIGSTSASTAGGWVSVSGSDLTINKQVCHYRNGQPICIQVATLDTGTVTITVNGYPAVTYTYGQNGVADTAYTVAYGLAGMLNSGSLVNATVNGDAYGLTTCKTCTISLASNVSGSAGNYSLSASSYSATGNATPSLSFQTSTSGANLTGGANATTTYDSGTLTVTVNGFKASAPYSQSQNSTASALAGALASALSVNGSPVTASASGNTINMTANGVGAATNYSVTGSSTTSFSVSSTTLSGGANPGGFYAAYVTDYTYDTLGNLTQVNQLGDGAQPPRVRSFTYDTLSRVLTSQNPESGVFSYSYDGDGNMLQRTSPAPNAPAGSTATQTISYCYEPLNRVTGKAYSAQNCTNGLLPAGTAAVSYAYDSAPNAIGKLISLTDQAGSASYAYDVLGRMSSETRSVIEATLVTKSVGYGYNLNGSLKRVAYPSGAVIAYTPDAAGRNVSAIDNINGINYLTGATYGPDNGITGFVYGSAAGSAGIASVYSYNNRLQPCRITASTGAIPLNCADASSADVGNVFDISYDFHAGNGDNGDVFSIVNNRDTTRTQSFTYDQLNRLTSAQNAGADCSVATVNGKTKYWGNSYGYDAWGNLLAKTVTKCSSESLSVNVTSANQFQNGYTYDAAGNMTHDATTNLNYTYDAENRIAEAAGYTYAYDAAGNRVAKSNGSSGTIYWQSAVGVIAESDLAGNLQTEYIFFGGERIARKDLPSNAISYYFSDHLQRTSVIADSAGNIKADSDYYPWGGELQLVNNDNNDYKFTGKKRDLETGLDYFGARYYSNSFGRFVTPDWSPGPATVPYARLDNPQTLNLYSYVDNNPVSGMDMDGHSPHRYLNAGASWEAFANSFFSLGADEASDPDENDGNGEGGENELDGTKEFVAENCPKVCQVTVSPIVYSGYLTDGPSEMDEDFTLTATQTVSIDSTTVDDNGNNHTTHTEGTITVTSTETTRDESIRVTQTTTGASFGYCCQPYRDNSPPPTGPYVFTNGWSRGQADGLGTKSLSPIDAAKIWGGPKAFTDARLNGFQMAFSRTFDRMAAESNAHAEGPMGKIKVGLELLHHLIEGLF